MPRWFLTPLFLVASLPLVHAGSTPQIASVPGFFLPADSGKTIIGAGAGLRARFEARTVTFTRNGESARLEFIGARSGAVPSGRSRSGSANFFSGVSSQPRSQRSIFQAVRYEELYPGIDLDYSYQAAELKSEYHVKPGASPLRIQMRYPGRVASIASDGALVLGSKGGELREAAPYVYQVVDGKTTAVEGKFRVISKDTVGFSLGKYDQALPLVIDPTVTFSTYWGGSLFDSLTGVAVAADGSIFVSGWTESYDATTTSAFQANLVSPTDAFVMHLSANGATVLFATFLGGSSSDAANGIAIDASGNSYVTGYTSSTNFPVAGPLQASNRGGRDVFVAKLNSTGNALLYSTYWGGSSTDTATGIAVDSSGNAYVTGNTTSTNFPVVNAFQSTSMGGQDAFLLKITANGASIGYSTYIGGSGTDQANAITLDNDKPVIAGGTDSPNFPVANAYQATNHGGQDAFVLKMNNTASALLFSTYLGGSSGSPGLAETAQAVFENAAGETYVGGTTSSLDFPLVNAYSTRFNGGTNDGFLAKLSSTGTALQFSTYLGGSSYDSVNAIAVDSGGVIYVAGCTASSSFPSVLPVQPALKGQYDAFLASFNPTASALLFSTFWGGSGSDSATGMALSSTTLTLVGQTLSWDFPLKQALQSTNYGNYGGFVTRFSIGTLGVGKVGIFRAGLWVIDLNGNGQWDGIPPDSIVSLGQSGDIPVTGDWNGDGHMKAGIFRGGLWVLDYNGNGQWDGPTIDRVASLGQTGDTPVVGDWNGDGKAKIGIFRAGLWVIDYNGNYQWDGTPTDRIGSIGQAGDTPVVGDWNGDKRAKIGIFRAGTWVLDYNGNYQWDGTPTDLVGGLGGSGDTPILGDWNGDKRTKIGIFRAGLWLLDYNGNGLWDGTPTDKLYSLGLTGDIPVVGDWNGDGRTKIGLFRNGTWYLDFDGDGDWRTDKGEIAISLGQAGDTPRVGPW